MKDLSPSSETLWSVVSSQGFSAVQTHEMKIAGGAAVRKVKCWSWALMQMFLLLWEAELTTELKEFQIHIKEFGSCSCKHANLPSETAVEVLQGCKAHILPAKVVQAS